MKGLVLVNTKKLFVGAAAATTLALGGGAALAAGPDTAAQQDETKQEEQEPSYTGSIKAPEEQSEAEDQENEATEDQREAAEGNKLRGLAKIDQTSAERAALEAVPGTVKETDLESENGFVVYGVEVAGNNGETHDVKVDAGTGEILHQQADGTEGPE